MNGCKIAFQCIEIQKSYQESQKENEQLKKENEELKFRLLDRSEKYSIAIDKGVLEQHYKIEKLTQALNVAEDALK